MSRGGRQKTRSEPERRCIATGESQPKAGLIRFVVGPDLTVLPDVAEKLPGRGIWVSADRRALEKAQGGGLFARAARQQVVVPPTLIGDVEAALVRRITGLLSLSRKAGQAVTGYEKVKSWIETDRAAVVLQASDGSERGKSKLRAPDRKRGKIEALNASELGLAFGRESAIHAALSAGGLTSRIVDEAQRLSGVRNTGGEKPAGKGTKTR